MAFNSRSYHRNKAKRSALDYIVRARSAKAEGRGADASSYARLARIQWRCYLSALRLDQMDGDMARLKNREISFDNFMAKWGGAQ